MTIKKQVLNRLLRIAKTIFGCMLIGFLSAVKKKDCKTSFCTSFTRKLFLDDSFISVWFIFFLAYRDLTSWRRQRKRPPNTTGSDPKSMYSRPATRRKQEDGMHDPSKAKAILQRGSRTVASPTSWGASLPPAVLIFAFADDLDKLDAILLVSRSYVRIPCGQYN